MSDDLKDMVAWQARRIAGLERTLRPFADAGGEISSGHHGDQIAANVIRVGRTRTLLTVSQFIEAWVAMDPDAFEADEDTSDVQEAP